MIKLRRYQLTALAVVAILSLAVISIVYAGSSQDNGQLPGTPAQVNYIAWINFGFTPGEILTEDGYNSALGVDQGYQNDTWYLNASNFSSPPGFQNAPVYMIFGGLGTDSGTIWTHNFLLDIANTITNQGTVGTPASGTCPTMVQGSQDGTGKTLNWSGPSSQYLIYKSTLPSGANNGASNGRYSFVASVSAGNYTYIDATCPTGTECWHIVVPGNGSGVPNGCHSEESTPTAISLSTFSASNSFLNSSPFVLGLFVVLMLAVVAFLQHRQKQVTI